MNSLQISQISKSFNGSKILDSVTFAVNKSEICGFIGLNGVGKTTLIKIILDLAKADEGQVKIFNINNLLPKSRTQICYLPEKFQPSYYLSGNEFLDFSLSFYKKKLSTKIIEQICDDFDFNSKFLTEKISTYSKGMVQKLGLISVFLSEANLLILDEPMSGLDVKARTILKKKLITYKAKGKSIFFSSHILNDIEEICDQIVILNNAKITFNNTIESFKKKYNSLDLETAFLQEIQ